MTEISKNPNKKLKATPLGKGVAAVALVGAGIVGTLAAQAGEQALDNHQAHAQLVHELQQPDALQEYMHGNIPHDKVVRLVAPSNMAPVTFAGMVEKDQSQDTLYGLTTEIQPQADAQNYPGLQAGEQVVVERDLVSPNAIKDFGVGDHQDSPVK